MTPSATTMLQSLRDVKQRHPDAIILFRVGDFYEAIQEDAVESADILGLNLTTMTRSNQPMQLVGFPHHALDTYLPRLVRAGKRVAIVEEIK